jgi:hypothetical protein
VRLSTTNAIADAGSRAAIRMTTIHSNQRGSRVASRSAIRPTMSSPRTPSTPVAKPYSIPTSPSDIPRVRIRNAGAKVVNE